jgi:DNA-binding NarL/FixJ family response regulator
MITIGIVDDTREIRDLLIRIFELFDDIEVKFDVDDGDQVMYAIDKLIEPPQVLIMDIDMKRQNGIETTRIVKEKYPATIILMLTVSENDNDILQAFEMGASGYLLKGEKPIKMYEFIKNAVNGNLSLSNKVIQQTMDMLVQNGSASNHKSPSDYGLSSRELDVLKLIVDGKNYNQIAEELNISPQTVRSHTNNIYRKLSVHTKMEAANLVLANKW